MTQFKSFWANIAQTGTWVNQNGDKMIINITFTFYHCRLIFSLISIQSCIDSGYTLFYLANSGSFLNVLNLLCLKLMWLVLIVLRLPTSQTLQRGFLLTSLWFIDCFSMSGLTLCCKFLLIPYWKFIELPSEKIFPTSSFCIFIIYETP